VDRERANGKHEEACNRATPPVVFVLPSHGEFLIRELRPTVVQPSV
jgi:hypothetical protein